MSGPAARATRFRNRLAWAATLSLGDAAVGIAGPPAARAVIVSYATPGEKDSCPILLRLPVGLRAHKRSNKIQPAHKKGIMMNCVRIAPFLLLAAGTAFAQAPASSQGENQ